MLREFQDEIHRLKEQLNMLHKGMDPNEIMKSHGVIGQQII